PPWAPPWAPPWDRPGRPGPTWRDKVAAMSRGSSLGTLALLGWLALAAGCDRNEPAPGPVQAEPPASSSGASAPAPQPDGPKVHERLILSNVYEVDAVYKSMQGPHSTEQVHLEESDEPELLWIVGFEAVMVEPDGKTQVSQEFMCH